MDKYFEEEWYVYLKKKFKLCDDDMEEYIDSFELINQGKDITPQILVHLINNEMPNNRWSTKECLNVIRKINKQINGNENQSLNLLTYLSYVIPICQQYVVNYIGIRDFFNELDKDNDGYITCEELTSVLYRVNKNFTPSDIKRYREEIKKICKKMDTNKDGLIDFNEFKKLMTDYGIIVDTTKMVQLKCERKAFTY
jgi:Ca2+-binding EF-hand superfamily protein